MSDDKTERSFEELVVDLKKEIERLSELQHDERQAASNVTSCMNTINGYQRIIDARVAKVESGPPLGFQVGTGREKEKRKNTMSNPEKDKQQAAADGRAEHPERVDEFSEVLHEIVGLARDGGGLAPEEIARILLAESREVAGGHPPWAASFMGRAEEHPGELAAKAMDRRTSEARAHERAMAAYVAVIADGAMTTHQLTLAEDTYREAYSLAMRGSM